MHITLKNIKHSAFASEETECFQATIYIDGKSTGTTVSNRGCGGCNDYHGGNAYERLTQYAKMLPDIETDIKNPDGSMFTYRPDADSIVDHALNNYLMDKELRQLCKTKVCFRIPGQAYADGEYHSFKAKYTPEYKQQLVKKYGPEVFILNESLEK